MADPFIEVEERIRDDRYRSLARRWLPVGIAILALVILFVGSREFLNHQQASKVAKEDFAYQQAVDKLSSSDRLSGIEALEKIETEKPQGYGLLAAMNLAQIYSEQGKYELARDYYDKTAQKAQTEPLAQLARLRAFYAAAAANVQLKDLAAREAVLSANGGDFTLLATEILVVRHIDAGNYEDARLLLDRIDARALNLPGLGQRAGMLREYLQSIAPPAIAPNITETANAPPESSSPPTNDASSTNANEGSTRIEETSIAGDQGEETSDAAAAPTPSP